MRHKYATQALVLARTPLSEAGMLMTLLTPDLGIIRARAEGVRRGGAKLAHALQALDESDVMLVRGKEGWRVTGAILGTDRFKALPPSARKRVSRVTGLLLRLVHGEAQEPELHRIFSRFIETLPTFSEDEQDASECLVLVLLLHALGLDSGALPGTDFDIETLATITEGRSEYITRINRGIIASGL